MPIRRDTTSPELIEPFTALTATVPTATRRQMFGFPMISGNMFTGLHQQTLFLRLSAVDRAEFMAAFAARPFEPRPSRDPANHDRDRARQVRP